VSGRYTNYATVNGNRISVPKTANVTEEKETNIPLQALGAIKCELSNNSQEIPYRETKWPQQLTSKITYPS
jgi:hypothetical protein